MSAWELVPGGWGISQNYTGVAGRLGTAAQEPGGGQNRSTHAQSRAHNLLPTMPERPWRLTLLAAHCLFQRSLAWVDTTHRALAAHMPAPWLWRERMGGAWHGGRSPACAAPERAGPGPCCPWGLTQFRRRPLQAHDVCAGAVAVAGIACEGGMRAWDSMRHGLGQGGNSSHLSLVPRGQQVASLHPPAPAALTLLQPPTHASALTLSLSPLPSPLPLPAPCTCTLIPSTAALTHMHTQNPDPAPHAPVASTQPSRKKLL